ncbi:hypothetical protein CF111_12750 [Aeromonas sobria]|uniref:EpsG family protein n=1 Tax=Aeromonas sobria TaxID=646 RepID=UPI001118399B|nr:EpsG family protein [Aeromonas sobria]TNJ21948.1 hypothetical protein CF111_12750 [Aeromonas sobria]
MLLLVVLFFIFFILSIFEVFFFTKISRWLKLSMLVYPMIFVFIISGFNTTSPDYLNYIQYISLSKLDDFTYINGKLIEPLFSFMSALLLYFSGSHAMTYAIFPVLSMIMIGYVAFKKSRYFFLAMLIYLSHSFLNKELIQIRAGLISSLLLMAVYLISERKIYRGGLLLISSSLVHFSASVQFIPLTFMYIMRNKMSIRRIVWSLVLLSFLFSWCGAYDLIINTLSSFNLIPDVVNGYLGWSEYNYKLGLLNPVLLKGVFILALSSIILKNEINNDFFIRASWVLYAFGVFWLAIFSDFAIMAARIAAIFNIFEIFLLPICLAHVRHSNKLVLFFLVSCYAVMTFIINIYIKNILMDIYFGFW